MKSFLATIVTLTTAVTTLAAPTRLQSRATTGRFADALTPIGSSLQTLNTAVNSVSAGNTQTGFNVLSASSSVSNSMTEAASQISGNGLGRPNFEDLGGLSSSTNLLMQQVQVTMDSFARQAPIFSQIGATQSAVQALQQQQTASGQLGRALVQQVPITIRSQAATSAQQISSLYDNGIAALQAGSVNAATPASSVSTGAQGSGTTESQGTGTTESQGTGAAGTQGTGSTGTAGTGTTESQGTGTTETQGTGAAGTQGTGSTGTTSTGTTGAQGSRATGTRGSGTTSTQGSGSGTTGSTAPGATGVPAFPGAAPAGVPQFPTGGEPAGVAPFPGTAPAGVPAFPTKPKPFGRAVAAPVVARRG